jgi:hypothetical protein
MSNQYRAVGRPKSEQKKAAIAAGLSVHQMKVALRIAAIPEDQFEALVESDNPPTINRAAAIGATFKRGGPPGIKSKLQSLLEKRERLYRQIEVVEQEIQQEANA